ncbi:integumentary mucin C.1 [Betta splendens]|uniref:Integumentary mucin C.1 n=1 Tax=Betta splendens TaxID=158456 RepID=A0A9W2XCD8_BETSP|nr:integumentary mucin C.1 [Betta splendens]
MAPSAFIKSAGVLPLLLLGLLRPAVLTNFTAVSNDTLATNSSGLVTNTTGATTTNSSGHVTNTTGATTTNSSGHVTNTTGATTTTMTSPVTATANMSGVPMHENTTNATSNMSHIYCPSFSCNHSDCYMMYNSRNFTPCGAGHYCQLQKQMGMHTVGCSSSCANCTGSMANCSVTCCNFTGCLNGSFASMMQTTTAPMTQTTTTTTTTTTSTPQTTMNNGNKCYKGTCTDTDCYTTFKNTAAQICSSTEKHCQLKKDTVDSKVQWTAGCTTNCSTQTPCKASTQPPCHLECCNATMTSCLWLNGTLNFPSSATRGPYLHAEVVVFFLCLFTSAFML